MVYRTLRDRRNSSPGRLRRSDQGATESGDRRLEVHARRRSGSAAGCAAPAPSLVGRYCDRLPMAVRKYSTSESAVASYVAPEQLKRGRAGFCSDVFSVAFVAYELLGGVQVAIVKLDPLPLTQRVPDLSIGHPSRQTAHRPPMGAMGEEALDSGLPNGPPLPSLRRPDVSPASGRRFTPVGLRPPRLSRPRPPVNKQLARVEPRPAPSMRPLAPGRRHSPDRRGAQRPSASKVDLRSAGPQQLIATR